MVEYSYTCAANAEVSFAVNPEKPGYTLAALIHKACNVKDVIYAGYTRGDVYLNNVGSNQASGKWEGWAVFLLNS